MDSKRSKSVDDRSKSRLYAIDRRRTGVLLVDDEKEIEADAPFDNVIMGDDSIMK